MPRLASLQLERGLRFQAHEYAASADGNVLRTLLVNLHLEDRAQIFDLAIWQVDEQSLPVWSPNRERGEAILERDSSHARRLSGRPQRSRFAHDFEKGRCGSGAVRAKAEKRMPDRQRHGRGRGRTRCGDQCDAGPSLRHPFCEQVLIPSAEQRLASAPQQ